MLKSARKQKLQTFVKTEMTRNQQKKFMKQKDLSRTEQCYVGITAIKANMTDTRLDLFISS